MDVDDFLSKELNIRGRMANLIHHLTYAELRRILILFARLQRDSTARVHTPRPECSTEQDQTGSDTGGHQAGNGDQPTGTALR